MKKWIFLFIFLVNGIVVAQDNTAALMPIPNHIEQKEGVFPIKRKLLVKSNNPNELQFPFEQLQTFFMKQMNAELILTNDSTADIYLEIDSNLNEKEHYTLDINKTQIVIKGKTVAAVFYGVVTLDQILLGDVINTKKGQIACVYIDDQPRFQYRALLIDPARHFIPINDIKFYIESMAYYKFNVLQLHLTDDQGWRVEIKKHPKLTEIGSRRNVSAPKNQAPHNGFYTQAQLKELVHFAALRNIEIVPEFDIPGHTVAILAAYPELGCVQSIKQKKKIGKTFNLMLCASNPKVYEVCQDIINELAEIFPSKRIHLGGDESVIEKNWAKCEHCQALMKQNGYTQAAQLMNVFFGQILQFVRAAGKEPILWCELDNIRPPAKEYLFNYPQDAILVTWRNQLTPLCLKLTAQHKNPIIMAPGEFCYLDYPQYKGDFPEHNNWGMPITTLQKTYQFDPGYGKPAQEQSHVLGVMGTLWGEAIQDINRINYMTYPRAFALSEAGWTQMKNRNWNSFQTRMYPQIMNLMKKGISVRAPFELIKR